MGYQTIDLRIRHPKGTQNISTLAENSSISDLIREISKFSNIPANKVSLKFGYPPQKINLPENTTLENIGIQSGETIIVEEDLNASAQYTSVAKNQTYETKKMSPQKTKPVTNNMSQVPNPEGLVMVRRVIPADNSCLFNSVAYALENKSKTKAKALRDVVAGYIMSDPERYSEVVLERPTINIVNGSRETIVGEEQ